jgi:hypothetical protein
MMSEDGAEAAVEGEEVGQSVNKVLPKDYWLCDPEDLVELICTCRDRGSADCSAHVTSVN